ncbi:MAG: hypothetical protein ACOVSS_09955, partial [Bacteroidia bacterium]
MRRVFRRLSLALLAALSLSFPACELINPDEEVPSFLFIDSFSFSTVYATQGLASFDFSREVGVVSRVSEVRELSRVLSRMSGTIRNFQAITLTLSRETQLQG